MAYLLKIAQTIPKAVVVNISNNHFTLTKGNVVIDFFTSNDAKVIHYKSQRSKSSLFSGDDSKVIIEDIRFRFFQRNL